MMNGDDETVKRFVSCAFCMELWVCLEGKLSENSVKHELGRGRRGAGDLIPWTISQEFSEEHFSALSGARVVRIATHPAYQNKGYGLQALKLLQDFYEGKFSTDGADLISMTPMVVDDDDSDIINNLLDERLEPRTSLPPLLFELNQVNPERLDYIGVSYGVSEDLLRFWKKAGFSPVYLAHAPNQLTGEHSCIMLKQLKGLSTSSDWLSSFWFDFCDKLVQCLPLRQLSNQLALDLITSDTFKMDNSKAITKTEVLHYLTEFDLELLKKISNCKTGYPSNYIISALSQFYFTHRLPDVHITGKEAVFLFSVGILNWSFETASQNLKLDLKDLKEKFRNNFIEIANKVLQLV